MNNNPHDILQVGKSGYNIASSSNSPSCIMACGRVRMYTDCLIRGCKHAVVPRKLHITAHGASQSENPVDIDG